MNARAVAWLVAGIASWALAFLLAWIGRDAAWSQLVGVIVGGSAGLMIGRAICFPRLDTWL